MPRGANHHGMRSKADSKHAHDQRRRSRVYIEADSDEESEGGSNVGPQSNRSPSDIKAVYTHPNGAAAERGRPVPLSTLNTSQSQLSQSPGNQNVTQRSRTEPVYAQRTTSGDIQSQSRTAQSRPRTRTLEERVPDQHSANLLSRTRHRVGSLQSPTAREHSGDSSSIGFPSIVSSPKLEAQARRQRLMKPHSRPLSPIRNPIASKSGTQLASSSTDAKKILQLMKTTCGRMQGILSFRNSSMSPWASGYCAINVATGSLIYQTKGEVSLSKTLINDLRGCQVRTLYDAESKSTFLAVATRRSSVGIHLRPHVPETFDQWLAALLCWQPIRPKGAQNKMSKPQDTQIGDKKLGDRKQSSSTSKSKDASIIKVGKMLMWEKEDNGQRSASPQPRYVFGIPSSHIPKHSPLFCR